MGGAEDHYSQVGDYHAKNHNNVVDFWDTEAPAYGKNGTYNCFLYAERTVDIVQKVHKYRCCGLLQ